MRGGQYNTYVFRCPTEGSSRTPTPTGGCVTDVSATIAPRASIRPRYEKDEKAKKGGGSIRPRGRKRLKSQKGWRGAFTPFRLFSYRVRVQPPSCVYRRKGGRGRPPLQASRDVMRTPQRRKSRPAGYRAANVIQLPNAKSRIVSGHSPPPSGYYTLRCLRLGRAWRGRGRRA